MTPLRTSIAATIVSLLLLLGVFELIRSRIVTGTSVMRILWRIAITRPSTSG